LKGIVEVLGVRSLHDPRKGQGWRDTGPEDRR
jgi:hypothetical protein